MKFLCKIFSCIAAVIICFSAVVAYSAASVDEAGIFPADDSYVPPYTVEPENSSLSDDSADNYILFYSQTTALALVAGYLILFKAKGIDHTDKMHSRSDKISK